MAAAGTEMGGFVSVNWNGTVVTITLTHVGKFNAMSRSMWLDLRQAFLALQGNTEVRCVHLRGADGHFCAGGDIAQYPDFRFDATSLRHFHEVEVWGALQAMLECDVPIVAQIEGNCMGAGVEIASCCDVRLAGASARFGAPIARLGFPMAPREAALVAQAVGATTARAMLLAAEVFDCAHMQTSGFLTRTVPDADVAQAAQDMAQRMATLAPQAARLNKQMLRALAWPELMSNQVVTPAECAQAAPENVANKTFLDPYAYADSTEHREGIAAFLEKRTARF